MVGAAVETSNTADTATLLELKSDSARFALSVGGSLTAFEMQHAGMLPGRFHPQCLDYTVEQVKAMAAFLCRACTASGAATSSPESRPCQALGLPPDLLAAIFALLGVRDRCARCLYALK